MTSWVKHISHEIQDPTNYLGTAGWLLMYSKNWIANTYEWLVAERAVLIGFMFVALAIVKKLIDVLTEYEKLKQEKIRTKDYEDLAEKDKLVHGDDD